MYAANVPPDMAIADIDESTLPPEYEQTAGLDPTTVDVPSGGTETDFSVTISQQMHSKGINQWPELLLEPALYDNWI